MAVPLSSAVMEGLAAGLPAFGKAGRLYFATDTGLAWYDTGAAWVNVTATLISLIQQQAFCFGVDTGGANAYFVTLNPTPTIVAGSLVVFAAVAECSGPSTLSIAVPGSDPFVKALTKAGGAPLAAGDIVAGQVVRAVYDGTQFQI